MAINNNTIMAKAWLQGTNDFQQRIPDPTQEGMQATMDALFDPMNRNYWNQFIDTLINRVGRTIVRGKRWENKLRAFKQDNLRYGNTIQEIAPKWIKAHSYTDFDDTLLRLARPEAQAWYHSVNRQDRYDISINDIELRRAFTEEYGLNDFISKVMEVPYNSDAYDEYIVMRQLIAMYEEKWGFFKVNLSAAPTTEATGKEMLTKVRTYGGKLAFPSTLYNASVIEDIPVFANKDELILITTPEVDANLDVQALAALFNVDKAEIEYRKVIIDEFPIAGAQALLTTRDWFVVHDVMYETTSFYNPQTLTTNYYLHHHEIVSCSPFVPAILFTTEEATTPATITMEPTGITLSAVDETMAAGDSTQLTVVLGGTVTPTGQGIVLAPDAATYDLAFEPGEGETGKLNARTYVDRLGVLHVQKSGIGTGTLTVTATSTYLNPGGDTTTYTDDVEITIA
jgi:hypothetical protein